MSLKVADFNNHACLNFSLILQSALYFNQHLFLIFKNSVK